MIKTYKQFMAEASKATPQLKNLKKDELLQILESFLYDLESIDVTEKMAGQMLKAKFDTEEKSTLVAPKALDGWRLFDNYNYHKDVMTVLNKFFLKQDKEIELHLEVLSDSDAHDYINYKLKGKVVIDFRGVLSQEDKEYLNKIDSSVQFMTKKDIKINHTAAIEELKKLFETKWKKEIINSKTLKDLRNLILPEIQDALGNYIAKEFRSAINGSDAVEGIFMILNGKGIKIPSKAFADLQRINVGVVNIMKMSMKSVKERITNPEDRLVTDMVKYLENNSKLSLDKEDLYKRLMSAKQSDQILKAYFKNNDTLEMYMSIRKLIK